MSSSQVMASGDCRPCRFVTLSEDFNVIEANANEDCFGIAQEGFRSAPIPDAVPTLAAAAGEQLRIYQEGEECLLELGDTVTFGLYLKSDSNGLGVPALTTGTTVQNIGAQALQDGASGEKIKVRVIRDARLPAAS